MIRYRVGIHVVPRRGLLDPQGKAVAEALHSLGFGGVHAVHVGRHLILELDAADEAAARALTHDMCAKLLANPVTEDVEISSVDAA